MKQGTVSVLVGCHSVLHALWVIIAWRRLNGSLPRPWQIGCILLHDVGHWGTQYLDELDAKRTHWELGARIARRLYGDKGYELCAGHCAYSDAERSRLYYADKYSYHICPTWWLWSNVIVEPKLRMGYTRREAIRLFKEQVAQSIISGEYKATHEFYMERCKGGKVRHENNERTQDA